MMPPKKAQSQMELTAQPLLSSDGLVSPKSTIFPPDGETEEEATVRERFIVTLVR